MWQHKKYDSFALFYQAHINFEAGEVSERGEMEWRNKKKKDSEELKLVHSNLFFRVFLLLSPRLAHVPSILLAQHTTLLPKCKRAAVCCVLLTTMK